MLLLIKVESRRGFGLYEMEGLIPVPKYITRAKPQSEGLNLSPIWSGGTFLGLVRFLVAKMAMPIWSRTPGYAIT